MTSNTWQDTLKKSVTLLNRSTKDRKQASALLWSGAQTAIEEWQPSADTDAQGEGLYAEVLDALGEGRKGDASKIKSVALATVEHGLVLSQYDNLSKAYAEATRLTKTVKIHAAEDEAADEAVQKIAATAPKSSSKPEGAAQIVLSKGVDDAARLLVDALVGEGKHKSEDLAAARALLRALQQEVAGRIAKPEPVKKAAAPKTKGAAKKATVKSSATKAKAEVAEAKPKPVARKAAQVKKAAAPVVEEHDDLDDLLDEVEETAPAPVKKAAPVRRAAPVKRPAR